VIAQGLALGNVDRVIEGSVAGRSRILEPLLGHGFDRAGHASCPVVSRRRSQTREQREKAMGNIFYIIGVVVVVLAILGYLGLR